MIRSHVPALAYERRATALLKVEEQRAKERQKKLAGTRRTFPSVEGKVDRHAGESAAKVGKALGVSRASVERAKVVKERAVPAPSPEGAA